MLCGVALSDPYFIERKLYPNVDFYSGLIYRAMGFPTDFFPVLFAIPRTVGWLAHWCVFRTALFLIVFPVLFEIAVVCSSAMACSLVFTTPALAAVR